MVITPFRLFLFVVAAFLAAGGTAYYTGALDSYFAPAPRQVAQQDGQGGAGSAATDPANTSKPATESPKTETVDAERPTQTAAGEDEMKSDDAQESGGGAERVVVPAFDIVRVEPDGSMVVAGHAAPKSNVEVVSGSTIVGKTRSGPEGDFAVVLDKPLEPGSHQIVLRSTTPEDVVATSKETAVVSVPETEDGEVLALVEAPGKPSRLITKPKAREGGEKQVAAASQSEADKTGAQASGEKAEPAQPRVAKAEPPVNAAADAGAKDADDSAPATDAGAMRTAGGSGAAGQNGQAQAAGSKVGALDSAPPAEEDGSPNDSAVATDETAPAERTIGKSVASADSAGKGKTPAAEKSDAKVFIEAVEIDGKEVFVAGGGIPGQRVRVYANDILLGDAVVSPNGRFLVQTTRELPVGDYIVRADLLSDNGAEVIARAAVPFEREPGEKLAAVAPSSRASDESRQAAGDEEPDAAASSAGKAATEDSPQVAMAAPQGASNVPDSKTAEAGSASEAEKPAVSEARPAGEVGDNAVALAGATQPPSAAENDAAAPAATNETGSGTGERMAAADARGGMQLPDLHNGLAESAPVVTAPKLETVDGAVIIRRGDTLWQISRRVYGRGVRYSTIYLANQQQIRDPDMIWPGQVFSVPRETKDGETADMKAIGEQAVPAAMAGTEPEWRR